jgi:peptide/nickel transport system permease protein
LRYVLSRLGQLVIVLLVVSFLTFLLLRYIPGDPVLSITGIPQSAADDPQYADRIAEARHNLHLDESIPVAYVHWLGDVLPPNVDLGYSYVKNTPVSELLGNAIPRTLRLMAYSIILSLVIAIPLGVLLAHKEGSWLDKILSGTAFGTIAIPNFVVAIVLVYIFAIKLGWLPATGDKDPSAGWGEHLKAYTLPVLSLSLGQAAVFARLLRTDMVTSLSEDFIGVAKAKGMPVRRILLRHALRPSSFTLLTVVGINIGQLIGGSVIIEFLFHINGLGSQLITAVQRSDYVFVQSGVVIVAASFVIVNFLIDFLYGFLDPRVRHARAH